MAEQNNEVFDEKSWDPPNWFCFIPKSECSNISYLYVYGHSRGRNWFCSIPVSKCHNISNLYFHAHSCGLGCGCGQRIMIVDLVIKKISKKIFCHHKWNNSVKKEKEKGENNDK